MKKSLKLELPRLVCVETTNRCNAKCVFCPNNALARDKGAMDQALFEKIIEDCRAFPLEAIEPFMQGDPFADPDIIPRLKHIRARLPDTKLRLYTNGYGMTPKRIDDLVDLGIDRLFISLNTLDEDRYQQVMGLRLARTLEHLKYLMDPSRHGRVAGKITFRMTRLNDTSLAEQDQFLSYCKEMGVRPFIVGLFDYKGDIQSSLPVPSYGCEHVRRLDILASGKVTLCCMDQDGEYSWGDVNTHSVLEVYRSERARKYRRMHAEGRRRDITPCGTCNNFWPDWEAGGPLRRLKTAVEAGAYFLRHRPTGRRAPESAPEA
ncbi:radical SAM protein [Myxococcota bacterium]|nr:radical SAM protein [Myxococcota bacterium]MBU1429752.1 radical SAM protein [Myxococcota bacterium]MBU1900470.1 radical SAM protein [Myxococcota bacterium]